MKVLHLISGGDSGGAKTQVISLLNNLQEKIDIKMVCFMESIFTEEAKALGIDFEVYKQMSRLDLRVVKRLEQLVIKEKIDIIHSHGARANFISYFLKRRVHKPFVTTIHSDYKLDFADHWLKNMIFTPLNTFALRYFDYYIAVSHTFKAMLSNRDFPEERIFTAYNGIVFKEEQYEDTKVFLEKYGIQKKEDSVFVGILARLHPVKNIDMLLNAARIVTQKNPQVYFLIGGDGEEMQALKQLTKTYHMQDKVFFLGQISNPYSFMNAIDINTLTSISETFPYVILEGAKMKKPIISTNVGGLPKLIENGKNGYMVEVGDYEKMAEYIIELASSSERRKQMGENLYTKVKNQYSDENMAKEYLAIYQTILKEKRDL